MTNLLHKISRWYFTRATLPYWCVLVLDCSFVMISGYIAFYLLNGGMGVANNFWQVTYGLLLSLIVFCIGFVSFHTFRSVMRYSSFVDLNRLAYSTACSCFVISVIYKIQAYFGLTQHILFPSPRSAVFIFILSTGLMWALRIIVKALHDNTATNSFTHNAFIYGCMQGGVALAKSIRSENPARYHLRGFISGDQTLEGSWLLGVKVYSDDDKVLEIMKQKHISTLLVSPLQTERFTNRTTLIDALIKAGIKIQMMSSTEEWDPKSELSHKQLREVEIEDLLPRQKIEVDMVSIGNMLQGKRILITGAAGSIGSEMARQVAKFHPSELILVDQAETPMHDVRLYMASHHRGQAILTIVGSITNQEQMETIFRDHTPEYVFHAAAYKHVPMMEDNPAMAVQNNIFGTRVIADLAVKYGTKKFVMISTDKAVNPTNVMGCSKRICEIYCQSLNSFLHSRDITQGAQADLEEFKEKFAEAFARKEHDRTEFITTRFGNVLGSNGSVIPIFKEQIRKGGPVCVTHPDIIRYFMLIPEACRLVLEAGTMGHGGEIFVFDMGEPVKIVDLAQRMIDLSGAKNVKIEFTGLRDGEKLYEELLATKENTKPTIHPKIMVAQVREYPFAEAYHNEEDLYSLSQSFDEMEVVGKMKQIVPEYKSQNSKYEELDARA